jgi:hypothetical protein
LHAASKPSKVHRGSAGVLRIAQEVCGTCLILGDAIAASG